MTGWDWNAVAEQIFVIAVGIGIGGWFVVDRFESAAMRLVTNPSVRKIANAADRMSGAASENSWPGLIGAGLNFLTGGRFSQAQGGAGGKIMVVNEAGEQVGWAERR